jgi:hypothetical protein
MTSLQMIGFDRSAFAARPHKAGAALKIEPSSCSIHDEGLSEHPIKSANQTGYLPIRRNNYEAG